MAKTTNDIVERFKFEQRMIQDYVLYVSQNISVSIAEMRRILHILDKYGFEYKSRMGLMTFGFGGGSKTTHENLLDIISVHEGAIKAEIDGLKKKTMFHPFPYPTSLEAQSIFQQTFNEVSQKVDPQIELSAPQAIEVIFSLVNEQLANTDLAAIDPELSIQGVTSYVSVMIEYNRLKEKLNDLQFLWRQGVRIQNFLKLHSDEMISLSRQAFILLMAVFDATVFDLTRKGLEKDFFKLIPIFSKGSDDKFAFKQFRDYSSFDEMKVALIERQLTGMYAKNLLRLLNTELKVPLVETPNQNGYSFADLEEMLNRRNIHLHNRGLVDEKYRELNLYNLDLDAPAPINQAYFDKANRICIFAVEAISKWIDSLPSTS